MGWPTAQQVLSQAGLELGLIQRASDLGENAYASDDPNVIQLCTFLKKAGRDLVDEAQWSQLRQEFSLLTGAGGQTWAAYPLPPDFRSMIDQAGWNRSTRLPLGGPLSEQEWQCLSSRLAGVVFTALFRPMQGLLYLYPPEDVPLAQSLVMAYQSAWWVQEMAETAEFSYAQWQDATAYKSGALVYLENADQPYVKNFYRCAQPGTSNGDPPGGLDHAVGTSGPIIDPAGNTSLVWNWVGASINMAQGIKLNFGWSTRPSGGTDILMFDEALLVAKVKMLWLQAKGFDSADAEREYRRQFETIGSNDNPAPILSLSRAGLTVDRLLGEQSYPITGYGS
jgi:hypothetical protein